MGVATFVTRGAPKRLNNDFVVRDDELGSTTKHPGSTLEGSWKPTQVPCTLRVLVLSSARMYFVDRLEQKMHSLYYINRDSIGTAVQWPHERGGRKWEVVAYRGSTVSLCQEHFPI